MFEDYILDFKYILLDVNRYSEEKLIELSNLIGTVFLLDQKVDIIEVTDRLKKMVGVLNKLSPEEFLLFKNWFKNVIARGLDEKQDDLIKIIEETGEVEAMVYNLERTIKEEIKKSRDEGIQEGKREGKLEGKLEIVKNLLQIGVNIEIIMKATGFSESEIVRIKREVNN